MKLTETEKHAFIAFQIRAQELNKDQQVVAAEIETRVGLKPGSIGNTHQVNLQAMEVLETPQGRLERERQAITASAAAKAAEQVLADAAEASTDAAEPAPGV